MKTYVFFGANMGAGSALPRQPSGQMVRKNWTRDESGRAVSAQRVYKRPGIHSDLINTAYWNHNGVRTIWGIAFDFDVERADPRWLDEEGRLDWQAMGAELLSAHPLLYERVAFVVRSTGGKGLALVIAINPIPILETTEENRKSGTLLQWMLNKLFHKMGFGADFGALGLVRDFPNYEDPNRCVYQNRTAINAAKAKGEKSIGVMLSYMNTLASAERAEFRASRVYPDARAEPGLSRLLLGLCGIEELGPGIDTPYYPGQQVFMTTKQIQVVTGLSDNFLRPKLPEIPWLGAVFISAHEGWKLWAKCGSPLESLLGRARSLISGGPDAVTAAAAAVTAPSIPLKAIQDISKLCLPAEVIDGERNQWLTTLALNLKWHGIEKTSALARIELRAAHIPGADCSVNVRQVPTIVSSIYRRLPETFGCNSFSILPSWITDDAAFASESTSPRRGLLPQSLSRLSVVDAPKAVRPTCDEPETRREEALTPGLRLVCDLEVGHQAEVNARLHDLEVVQPSVKIAAIRRCKRVGVFDGGTLVMCLTSTSYTATKLVALLETRPEYIGKKISVFTPHKQKQEQYYAEIEAYSCPVSSGAKIETRAVRLARWLQSREVNTEETTADGGVSFEPIPF